MSSWWLNSKGLAIQIPAAVSCKGLWQSSRINKNAQKSVKISSTNTKVSQYAKSGEQLKFFKL